MKNNKIQKNFIFSSNKVKDFVEYRADDLATLKSHSSSFVVEEALLSALLPQNKKAQKYIIDYLYNKNDGGVKKTLQAIFTENKIGPNQLAKNTNLQPLINFCLHNVKGQTQPLTPKAIELISKVNERINILTKSCIELDERYSYSLSLNFLTKIIEEINDDQNMINPKELFTLFYNCWDMLEDWTVTYDCLCAFCSNFEFAEDVCARNDLFTEINQLSNSWDKKNPKKEICVDLDRYISNVLFEVRPNKINGYDDIIANDVVVGYLITNKITPNIIWLNPPQLAQHTKFMFRHFDTFCGVISKIRQYQKEQGYEYLGIMDNINGYPHYLGMDFFECVGFKNLPNWHPNQYFL